jgi:2-oxoglutarate ferredoxin oxidoreductase subunit alpha
VVCELNEGQFAAYLRQEFEGLHLEQFNKTEGQPFTIVELTEKFSELLK